MFSLFTNVHASTRMTYEDTIVAMNDLQNRITAVLELRDGKYTYNYNEIKNIVYEYEFEDANEYFGTNYTQESFLNKTISLIEDYEYTENENIPSVCAVNGICNQTWTIDGWNYTRTAQTKQVTAALVNDCRNSANILTAGGSIGAGITWSVPPLAAILGGAGALGALYYNNLANNLEYQNSLSNCGTVLDINKLFPVYYQIWNQVNYTG